ncbi:hypothetical protein AXG93_2772s1140 [Marchantia polymorpha subsp. ruderalis]|uniref:Uncharacterized protein n=1 Tax=Marchantia polymorpha subsp. ruderalis TaxID=1480154 RepID=A0A176WI76_MARPO|nr:hypothetical protein AXG93_2772s1140 [Marchantia polymorpha subsp. ruderalis]
MVEVMRNLKQFVMICLTLEGITNVQGNFLDGSHSVEVLFGTICSCLTYLEADESTFSSVYACFLAVAHHFRTLPPDKPLLAIHKMPTKASAVERNSKSAKRVHLRNRYRLAAGKVEAGTVIVFNAQQLTRRASIKRNGPFVLWLKKLGVDVVQIDEMNDKQECDEEDV